MKKLIFTLGIVASLLGLFTFLTGKDLTSFKSTNYSGIWSDRWGSCQDGIAWTYYRLKLAQSGDHVTGRLSVYWRRADEHGAYDIDGRIEDNVARVEVIDTNRSETAAIAKISEDELEGLFIKFVSGNEGGVLFPDSVVCHRGEDDSDLSEYGWKM